MYIESHVVEGHKPQMAQASQSQWVKPAIDVAFEETVNFAENTPAEIRTPSSACLNCAYNAYAQNLGCINAFATCPYLTR